MQIKKLEEHLQVRKNQGLLRTLSKSRRVIDFTSNDYFGFARSLVCSSSSHMGATGSRLLTGNHPFYEELERKIAHFHTAKSCVIFNCGYMANLGLIAALGVLKGTFLYDLEIHASMIDGIRLSGAKSLPFRHNDLDSLERRLKERASSQFVLVESIYSISGDFAPLKEIAALCAHYKAALIVDEAHATGICGLNGKGYVAELGLESQVFARIHTFSKALGSHGACVLGDQTLKEYLINFSRPLIYTTALPLDSLLTIETAYKKLKKEALGHQKSLKRLIAYFQKRLSVHGPLGPIQTIYVSGVQRVRALSQKLIESGLDVRAIVSPTTKRGRECLRIVLHSFNQEEEIDQLAQVLG